MVDATRPKLTRTLSGRTRLHAHLPKPKRDTSPPEDLLVDDSGDLSERPPAIRQPLPTPIEKPIARPKSAGRVGRRPSAFTEELGATTGLLLAAPHQTPEQRLHIAAVRLKLRAFCTLLASMLDESRLGPRTTDQMEMAIAALTEALRCLPATALQPAAPQDSGGMVFQFVSER